MKDLLPDSNFGRNSQRLDVKEFLSPSKIPPRHKSEKRVGILGGTFNPVHIGHLAIAQLALDKLKLDQVVFVPCFLPPHKSSRGVVAAKDRLTMVQLAVEGNPKFEVSDFEIRKGGKSYSFETVQYFRDILPKGSKIFFIVGGDAVAGLRQWRRIDEILKSAMFVVVNRKGYEKPPTDIKAKFLLMPEIDISSSAIRRRIRSGENVTYLVPQKVLGYIVKKKFYL